MAVARLPGTLSLWVRRLLLSSLVLWIGWPSVSGQEQYMVKTIKSFEKGVFFYDIEIDKNHPDTVYATDLESHCIRSYNNKTGEVKIYAGQEKHGYQDGWRQDALFYKPRELCQTPDGSLYVVDSGNFVIRKIDTRTGNVTTVAGNHTEPGSRDGAGSEARFTGQVVGIKCLADGTLLVADPGNPTGGGSLRKVACPNCTPHPDPPPPSPSPQPTPSPAPPSPVPKPSGMSGGYPLSLSIAINVILVMLLFIIVVPPFLSSQSGGSTHHQFGHHRSTSLQAYDIEDGEYAPLMPDYGITAYSTNSITSMTSSRNGRRGKHRKNNSMSQRFNWLSHLSQQGYPQGPPSIADSLDDSTMATQGTATHVGSVLMHDDGYDSFPPTPYHPDLMDDMGPNLLRRSAGHRSEDEFLCYTPHDYHADSEADLDSQPATPYASDMDDVQHLTRQPFGMPGARTSHMLTAHTLQQLQQQHGHLGKGMPASNLAPVGMSSASSLPPLPSSSSRPGANAPGRPPLPRSSTTKDSRGEKKWPQSGHGSDQLKGHGTEPQQQREAKDQGLGQQQGVLKPAERSVLMGTEDSTISLPPAGTPGRKPLPPPKSPFASEEAQTTTAMLLQPREPSQTSQASSGAAVQTIVNRSATDPQQLAARLQAWPQGKDAAGQVPGAAALSEPPPAPREPRTPSKATPPPFHPPSDPAGSQLSQQSPSRPVPAVAGQPSPARTIPPIDPPLSPQFVPPTSQQAAPPPRPAQPVLSPKPVPAQPQPAPRPTQPVAVAATPPAAMLAPPVLVAAARSESAPAAVAVTVPAAATAAAQLRAHPCPTEVDAEAELEPNPPQPPPTTTAAGPAAANAAAGLDGGASTSSRAQTATAAGSAAAAAVGVPTSAAASGQPESWADVVASGTSGSVPQ